MPSYDNHHVVKSENKKDYFKIKISAFFKSPSSAIKLSTAESLKLKEFLPKLCTCDKVKVTDGKNKQPKSN